MFAYKPLQLFLLIMLQAVSIVAQNGVINGRIVSEKTNEPLPFVNLIVFGMPNIGASTDINGNFTISGLKPGYVKLTASSIGYEQITTPDILVTNAKVANIEIRMTESIVLLQKVDIVASAFAKNDDSPISVQTLGISEIEKNPGSNRDISRVIQALPGVASTPTFRNDVIVRGGGASENRFYLDGIEIPNLNHFSTQGASGGPIGIINVDFIREVDFYSGAFPASRGNALSSVIEFRQVDGNKEKWGIRTTLGATDLALTADGPLTKKSSLIFSLRRSYLRFVFDIIGLPFLPTYNDYQLKYKLNIDQNNQISIISIGAIDDFKLNTGLKNPDESQRYILSYLPVFEQWNYTIGIIYRHFRKTGYDTWVASRNMLNNTQRKYTNNIETPGNLVLDYDSDEIENKLRYESTYEFEDLKIIYGTGGEYAKYNNKTYQKIFVANQLREIKYNSVIDLFKYNAFGQMTHSWLSDRLTASFGVRVDGNSYSALMSDILKQFSPRLSFSYMLREKFNLNFNIGRYFQLPPYTTLGYRDVNGSLVNKENRLKYMMVDHLVLGFDYLPNSVTKISIEGFYKKYDNYPFSVDDSISLASKGGGYGSFGDEEVTSTSSGRAYGFEVLLRDRNFKGFNIIVSYTFVRSEFTDYKGIYLPSNWDNKHLLNITISRKLKNNWDVGLKWRYVGGTPYTPYDLNTSSLVSAWDTRGRGFLDYSRFNELRLKPFHQLDVRVDKQFFYKHWSLMLYVDIQNLYNFQSEEQDIIVNTQPDGSVMTYTDDLGKQRYKLRNIKSTYGTVLPSVGIMLEF